MELVAILRVLWRQRILVALGAVLAIALGLMVARGETNRLGIAATRVVLDTPDSQLIHPVAKGADSLAWRAALLANLMASESVRRQIARDIRIPVSRLIVIEPLLTRPTVPTPLAPVALEAAAETTGDYVLTVRHEPELPIISLETSAPDLGGAKRLADAATQALKTAAKAPPGTRERQGLVADSVGAPQGHEVVNGPGRVLPLALAAMIFAFWCAGLALVLGIARAWRAADRVQPA